jgi:type VI secretion system protein ImpA
LLQPISAEQPCGPDLSNDPRLSELENLLKGTPEVEIGSFKKPAEPPEWRELQEKSIAFLRQSKDLRVAMMLCGSLARTGGVAGFRDGVQLVGGLVEQYWPTMYPLLDPEDDHDPTQRLNKLKALTEPRGSLALGWLTILDFLHTAPLFGPQATPVVSFDLLRAARQASGGTGQAVAAAMQKAGVPKIQELQQCVQEAANLVQSLDQFLTNTLGKTNTISFEVLDRSLQEMLGLLNPYLTGGAVEPTQLAAAPQAADQAAEAGQAEIKVKGAIRSSSDVARAIDQICEYYRQVEPSSPVPFLLRRAQKLAKMDFVQAVQELNLATVDTLRPSMGSALPADLPAGSEPAAPS